MKKIIISVLTLMLFYGHPAMSEETKDYSDVTDEEIFAESGRVSLPEDFAEPSKPEGEWVELKTEKIVVREQKEMEKAVKIFNLDVEAKDLYFLAVESTKYSWEGKSSCKPGDPRLSRTANEISAKLRPIYEADGRLNKWAPQSSHWSDGMPYGDPCEGGRMPASK